MFIYIYIYTCIYMYMNDTYTQRYITYAIQEKVSEEEQ